MDCLKTPTLEGCIHTYYECITLPILFKVVTLIKNYFSLIILYFFSFFFFFNINTNQTNVPPIRSYKLNAQNVTKKNSTYKT